MPIRLLLLQNRMKILYFFLDQILMIQICGYLDLIWDDAEELKRLAQLSHPKAIIDTSQLSTQATYLANLLALKIDELDIQFPIFGGVFQKTISTVHGAHARREY